MCLLLCGCSAGVEPAPESAEPAGEFATEPAPGRATTAIDLIAISDVALVEGAARRAGTATPPPPDAPLVMRAGSAVTYYFLLPRAAHLTGLADAVQEPAHLAVELTTSAGDPRTIVSRSLGGAPEPFDLDVDLTPWAEQMVELRFSLRREPPDAGDDAELVFRRLEISGFMPETPGTLPAARKPYNVLVVLFDSLRADETAPYGAAGRTPNLARLASEGVVFTHARSSASWTRASIAALFSSYEPEATGILTFANPLPEEIPYLPEILSQAGYRTLGVSRNAMISNAFGFERGFDELVEVFRLDPRLAEQADPEMRAAFVWNEFLKPVVETSDARPFFVYLHELDPHSPYDAPEPYRSLEDFGYVGDLDTTFAGMRKLRREPEAFDAEDTRELKRRYRAEISFMDTYLGFLLKRLDEVGRARDTLLVFVSDHGEEFRDHGGIGHGNQLFEELLRVPLVLRLPGVLPAGRRVRADARLIDVPATVLDLLGIDAGVPLRGESLLPWIENEDAARPGRASYGSALEDGGGVVLGRWKLVRHGALDAPLELFDLERDPGELQNVADENPIVVGTLAQLLRSNRRQPGDGPFESEPPVPLGDVDRAVRENLRALGYVE